MWRLVAPLEDPFTAADWRRLLRPGGLVTVGLGTRIEYIGPAYNWAEGSRAIEARRGAAAMRTKAWNAWEWRQFQALIRLLTTLRQLNVAV